MITISIVMRQLVRQNLRTNCKVTTSDFLFDPENKDAFELKDSHRQNTEHMLFMEASEEKGKQLEEENKVIQQNAKPMLPWIVIRSSQQLATNDAQESSKSSGNLSDDGLTKHDHHNELEGHSLSILHSVFSRHKQVSYRRPFKSDSDLRRKPHGRKTPSTEISRLGAQEMFLQGKIGNMKERLIPNESSSEEKTCSTDDEGYCNLSLPASGKKCRNNIECNQYEDDDSDVFVGADQVEWKTPATKSKEQNLRRHKSLTLSESGNASEVKKRNVYRRSLLEGGISKEERYFEPQVEPGHIYPVINILMTLVVADDGANDQSKHGGCSFSDSSFGDNSLVSNSSHKNEGSPKSEVYDLVSCSTSGQDRISGNLGAEDCSEFHEKKEVKEENDKTTEENDKRTEENDKRTEENDKRTEENDKRTEEKEPVGFKQDFESKSSEAEINGKIGDSVQPTTSLTEVTESTLGVTSKDSPQEQSYRKTEQYTDNKNESPIEVLVDKSSEDRIHLEEGNCERVLEVLTYREFYKKYMKKPVYDVTCLMVCYVLCMTTELGLDLYRLVTNQTVIQNDIDGAVLIISEAMFGLLSLMISSVFLKRFWKRRDRPQQKEQLPQS